MINTMSDKRNLQGKKGVSPIGKQAAYSKAAAYFQEALETCVDVMRNSNNDNARLGASRTIINKVLPDLKATDITSDDLKQVIEGLVIIRADKTK